MSLYDVTFDLVIRLDDPSNGIDLNQNISKISDELTEQIRRMYPTGTVLPRGFDKVIHLKED